MAVRNRGTTVQAAGEGCLLWRRNWNGFQWVPRKTLPFPKACFTEIIMDVAYTDAHMISLKSLSDSRVYCQLLPKQKGTRGASRFRCRARRLVRFPLSTKQWQPQPLKALSWQAELPPLWPVHPQLSQIKKERGKQKEKCILQSLLKAKE